LPVVWLQIPMADMAAATFAVYFPMVVKPDF
jgi:hypothetical protein